MSQLETGLEWAFVDPPFCDPEYPADHVSFRFENGSEPVFGHVWIAQGAARKGTVLIPPQTWGGDSLESVVPSLLRCGINAISFVPRGMWDRTQPTYTMYNAVDDVHALIAYVQSDDYDPQSAIGKFRARLDPERIALFGVSGGGANVGLAACAESTSVDHVVAVGPVNIDNRMTPEAARESYEMVGRPWFADAAIAALPQTLERLSAIRNAERLAKKHVFLIGPSHDADNPCELNHKPIAEALCAAGAAHLTEVILESDGGLFLTKRNALAKMLIEWLRREASF